MKPVKINPKDRSNMWKPEHPVWFKHNEDYEGEQERYRERAENKRWLSDIEREAIDEEEKRRKQREEATD